MVTSPITHSLHSWMHQNKMKCPICRQDATATVKLIYDIKYVLPSSDQDEDSDANIKTTEEIVKESNVIKRQNEILKEQVKEMTENYNDISKQIDGYIEHLEENEKKVKEYKNQALRLTLQIEEIQEINKILSKDVQHLNDKINDLEKEKKDLQLTVDSYKKMNEYSKEIEQNKEISQSLQAQCVELMNRNDNGRALSEFLFVFQSKIQKLQEENEELKKKNSALMHSRNSNAIDDHSLIKIITGVTPHKRKYNEYLEENKRLSKNPDANLKGNNENKKIPVDNKEKDNTTIVKLFTNPLKRKGAISFLNKK